MKTVLYETGEHTHDTERDRSAVIKKDVRAKLDELLSRSEKCGPEALRTSLVAHFGENYQAMPTLSQVCFTEYESDGYAFYIGSLLLSLLAGC